MIDNTLPITDYPSPVTIGITGQSGFIGTHLANTIYLYKDKYVLVDFDDSYFQNEELLNDFVNKCDVIVHLAALNRHSDPGEILRTNVALVEKLISALERTNSKPHIIFSSSTQEERDNAYGSSKKIGRELFERWADRNKTNFTGLIIPNVFGPFGVPFHNSFISTFSHQLTHNLEPKIEIDAEVGLIYISELVKEILSIIDNNGSGKNSIRLEETSKYKVSDILLMMNYFKKEYLDNGIIPALDSVFKVNLFNTFRSYIDLINHFPFKYKLNKDERGIFVELIKHNSGGQLSYSTTKPGITRGNHFHTRKVERFAVIKGKAEILMRKINTKEIFKFNLSEDEPSFVDMPIWYTHNITNIGNEELITIFWINEFYDPNDSDTFYEPV
jgi:UDP-2-acetamido-2,6-beta-L-arabino-hexul-4-ose reductase